MREPMLIIIYADFIVEEFLYAKSLTLLLIPSKLAVSSAEILQRVNLPYGIWFIRSITKTVKFRK